MRKQTKKNGRNSKKGGFYTAKIKGGTTNRKRLFKKYNSHQMQKYMKWLYKHDLDGRCNSSNGEFSYDVRLFAQFLNEGVFQGSPKTEEEVLSFLVEAIYEVDNRELYDLQYDEEGIKLPKTTFCERLARHLFVKLQFSDFVFLTDDEENRINQLSTIMWYMLRYSPCNRGFAD